MNKFQEAKEKHPHLEGRLTKLEKEAKMAEIMLDLRNHEGVKQILAELEQMINVINTKLMSPKRLETEARELLMTDKERCLWLLNKFPGYEKVLERINKYLEKL